MYGLREAMSPLLRMGLTALRQFITIPVQVMVEEWEEIYLDPWIESVMYKWGNYFGWSDGVSSFWGNFITSFREAFMGAAKFALKGMVGGFSTSGSSTISPDIDTVVDASIDSLVNDIIGEQSDIDFATGALDQVSDAIDLIDEQLAEVASEKEKMKTQVSAWSVAKRILSLGMLIPSFTVGAGGTALFTHLLDYTVDNIFDLQKVGEALYRRKLTEINTQLTGRKHALQDISIKLQSLITEQSSVSNVIKTSDPSNPYSALSSSAQLQGQIAYNDYGIEYNVEFISQEEYMKQRKETIKEATHKVEAIQTVSLETSDTVGFMTVPEEQVADMAAGDPVIKGRDGVIQWWVPEYVQYHPLTGKPYTRWIHPAFGFYRVSEGELDLDGFIAMLPLEEGDVPVYKGTIIYPGYTVEEVVGDTIVETPLRCNMPISQVFDLIGYDRSLSSLQNQFLGKEQCIVITSTALVRVDERTRQHFPGFAEIKQKYAPLFENPKSLFSSDDVKQQLENVFNQFMLPAIRAFEVERTEILSPTSTTTSVKNIRFLLETFVGHFYKTMHNKYLNPDATKEQKKAVYGFIDDIFTENYGNKFDYTVNEEGTQYVQGLFFESVKYSALAFFLEEVKAEFDIQGSIEGKDLAFHLEKFLTSKDMNELIQQFVRQELPRILLKFAESFESPPRIKKMIFSHSTTTQIGWEHETLSMLAIASYFMIKEFIDKGYDKSNLVLYKYFVYDPTSLDLDTIQDFAQVLGVVDADGVKDVLNQLNNGVDLFGKSANFREGDLVSFLFKAFGFYTWECKNSMDSNSEYLFSVIGDLASTIFVPLTRSVAQKTIDIEKHTQFAVVGIDPDDGGAISRIVKETVSIHEAEDFITFSEEEKENQFGLTQKYAKNAEFYSKIATLINDHIKEKDKRLFYAQLVHLFRDSTFTGEIRKISTEIFGYSKKNTEKHFELVKDKLGIEELVGWVDGRPTRINNLLVRDKQGDWMILYDVDFNHYKMTEIPTPSEITSKIPFFIIKDGGKYAIKTSLTSGEKDRVLQGNLVAVHNEKGVNGLLLLEDPQVKLPQREYGDAHDITDGYQNPITKIVVEGVYVARKGYLTKGRVYLDPALGFRQYSDAAIASILDESVQEHSITHMNPITKKVVEGLPFASKIKNYYSFEHFRSASHQSGSLTTYVIQEDDIIIIPTGQHEKIVSGSIIRRAQMQEDVVLDPFADIDSKILYGEFTKEVFMQVFSQLFFSNVDKAIMFATKYLSYLNGISLGSNFENFLEGQDINDINMAIRDLKFTEDELQKFIWKIYDASDSENPWKFRFADSEGKFTVKRWLKLIYDKIISYSDNDGSVYALQRDKLISLVQRTREYSIIDDPSINRNIEKFTVKEARFAVEIFKSAVNIFGHFTLRLMMMNMISYYGDSGNFGLIFNSRNIIRASKSGVSIQNQDSMVGYLHHTGLISPTFKHDRPLTSIIPKHEASFFGLSTLNTRIYLKLEGTKDIIRKGYNTLEFPVGPLIGLEGDGRFSGRDLTDLGYNVGNHFGSISSGYLTFDKFIDFFEERQSKLIDYIIKYKIEPGLKFTRVNKKQFMEELMNELREDLLYIKKLQGLREELELFAKNPSVISILITLNTINPFTGRPTTFEITKTDLSNMGYVAFGWRQPSEMLDYMDIKKSFTVEKVFNYLNDIIRLVGNEKVILVPLFNTGDPKVGYQVLRRIGPSEDGYSERVQFPFLPKDGYIKLDQNDPNYEELLKYCIRLVQGGRCAFVVKQWQESVGDLGKYLTDEQGFIMAFNRDNILNPTDILSSDVGINYVGGYESFNVNLGDYSTLFRPVQRKWEENWICNIPLRVGELKKYLSKLLEIKAMSEIFNL
jgi:hypothetical protein